MSSLVFALKTQQALSTERLTRRRKERLRSWPKPRWPSKSRLAYYQVLAWMVDQVQYLARRDLYPKLPSILDTHNISRPEAAPIRHDATGGDVDKAIAELELEVDLAIPETLIEMEAQKHVIRVTKEQGAELQKQVHQVAAINLYDDHPGLAEHLEVAVADNVRLIKDLSKQQLKDMAGIITRGARQGLHHTVIASQLEDRFKLSKKRAALIATDQTGKLNGELNAIRQQNLGVRRYRWSTSKDERVRASHRALEGTIQRWDKPPVVDPRTGARGHPGQPVRCRCQPIPIIDDVLVEAGLMDPSEVELGMPESGPFKPRPSRPPLSPTPPKPPTLPPVPPGIPQPPPANVPLPKPPASLPQPPPANVPTPSERVGPTARKVFRRDLSDADIEDLVGARAQLPDGYRVEVARVEESERKGKPAVRMVGAIRDADNEIVGTFVRKYTRDPRGGVNVAHDAFFLNDNAQAKGIGRQLFNAQINAYEQHGVSKVSLRATEVGKYVWTKAGFDWSDPAQFDRVRTKLGGMLRRRFGKKASAQILKAVRVPSDIARLRVGEERVGKDFLVDLEDEFIPMSQTPSRIKRL